MRTGISWLDLKLGVRMLAKYPGLTLVGGLAIAVAMAIAGGWSEFSHDYFHPTLPVPGGERIVGIQNWDAAANRPNPRVIHDFVEWSKEVRSIQGLGAFRTPDLNLITTDGRAEPVSAAEITPSVFRIITVPPLMGRPLVDADERADAAPVAVIGYDLWQSRFGGDAHVIGRAVRLGAAQSTIVGVMPQGFAFPVRQSLWLPLRLRASDYPRGGGPALRVFGRLAPGATIDQAQAELTPLGVRAAGAFPETNAKLRPRVRPYLESITGPGLGMVVYAIQTFLILIILVVCANVATLVFARTATRQREIAVRLALGASRGRIVSQLFAEALVLASVAAAIGLGVVWWGQGWGMDIFWNVQGGTQARPFWWNNALSPSTVLYVGGLTVFGAAIAGVLPALKATTGGVQARLQQAAADASGMRFGGLWTTIIVLQVGISVLALPSAALAARQAMRYQTSAIGFPAAEYLAVRVSQDGDVAVGDSLGRAAFLARFRSTYRELELRLAAEPGVLAVSAATKLPATDAGSRPEIEVDGMTGSTTEVNESSVEPGLFAAFGAKLIAGRDFDTPDASADRHVVIVNRSFVQQVLGGRSAIGRRIRYAAARQEKPGPWYEIVGVVPDLAMNAFEPDEPAGFYRPLLPQTYPVQLAVHMAGKATAFTPRLRAIALALDPTLRLDNPQALDASARALEAGGSFGVTVLGIVALVALLLSTTGIYALMSFTVAQRTREIGIRAALGANRRQIVGGVLSRAFLQMGIGVVLGAIGVLFGNETGGDAIGLLAAMVGVVMVVGMLACWLPVRRAVRIQPTEALRAGN